ncbi:MAG: MerR family transcriptional regulator [Acetobacteraceae bacterium]|jgi:DNA-binding transcriptional MerR regulator
MVDPAIPTGARSDNRLRARVGVASGAGAHDQDDDPPDTRSDAADDASGRARIKKAPNAFRTISEVADDLHIPQHVLRFWETKFPQVRPMKRGGGRRYYRPDDIALLRRISDLLYIQGYTIKGVQRLLREGGGQLSDDIPPPPADERATAEAEPDDMHNDQSELLIPGLELASDPPSGSPVAAPRVVARRRTDTEADRLRSLLAETLTELEAIRALLG